MNLSPKIPIETACEIGDDNMYMFSDDANHILTPSAQNRTMQNDLSQKIPKKHVCDICDYSTCSKKDYSKHLLTSKHKSRTSSINIIHKTMSYSCECGKIYKARNSLWYHRKKCTFLKQDAQTEADTENEVQDSVVLYDNESNNDDVDFKGMFMEAMQQNKELQKQITDLIPKVGNTTHNTMTNNTTNNTNNQFNLNFFLNEQCKDAIPLIDFVKSLQYDFDQLEYTGKHGFVEGASKIIMDAMNQLDITKRPIHCTDVKRETFYVKDDESWKKEDERNRSIKTAIHNIRNRNLACVPEWIKAHPNCKKIDDPNNDLFIEIIGQYMDASEKEFIKVIKTIAKSLTIPKNQYGRRLSNNI